MQQHQRKAATSCQEPLFRQIRIRRFELSSRVLAGFYTWLELSEKRTAQMQKQSRIQRRTRIQRIRRPAPKPMRSISESYARLIGCGEYELPF